MSDTQTPWYAGRNGKLLRELQELQTAPMLTAPMEPREPNTLAFDEPTQIWQHDATR